MARLSPTTLQALARDLYGYELGTPALAGLQQPFGYATLLAEADRLRLRR